MKKVHLIGNAHIDPVWLWKKPEGLSEIKSTFRSALDRMREFPDYVFTSACAGYYAWVEAVDPGMFREIQERVRESRWCIAGGLWVQPDCNIPSGEAFARHILYAQNYFREKFGKIATVGYNVDSFGHNGMLPQLLRKGGMDSYVFMRPDKKENPDLPGHVFRWQSPDGSRVTAFKIYMHYGDDGAGPSSAENAVKAKEMADAEGLPFMSFYGVGNHGGGPSVENLKALTPLCDGETGFSSPQAYFEDIKTLQSRLPVVTTDLQHHASGCYAAFSPVKVANRRAEQALVAAEIYDTMAGVLLWAPGKRGLLRPAWEKVMFNQFHDILAGCCIREAYTDALNGFAAARDTAEEITSLATQRISWNIKTTRILDDSPCRKNGWILWEKEGEGAPVVVFNPHSFPVRQAVQLNIVVKGITDHLGKPVQLQHVRGPQTNGGDLLNTLFMAEIPAWGYATYYVFKDHAFSLRAPAASALGNVLENEHLRVALNRDTGAVESLVDKAEGRELSAGNMAEALVIDDRRSDTWAHGIFTFEDIVGRFSDPVITVIDKGPLRACIRVETRYGQSRLCQDFILHQGCKALEVRCKLDYREKLKMLKLSFPANLENAKAVYSMPYDFIEKPADGAEEPAQTWMALSEGDRGLALLNDSKYSFSAKEGGMRMVAARGCIFADHFGQRDGLVEYQDQGEQFFSYVLKPFSPKELPDVIRAAQLLNKQPEVILETHHQGVLEPRYTGIAISAPNVIAQTIKLPETYGEKPVKGYILRLWETAGAETETVLTLGLLHRQFTLSFKPQEIKTVFVPEDGGDIVETDLTERRFEITKEEERENAIRDGY